MLLGSLNIVELLRHSAQIHKVVLQLRSMAGLGFGEFVFFLRVLPLGRSKHLGMKAGPIGKTQSSKCQAQSQQRRTNPKGRAQRRSGWRLKQERSNLFILCRTVLGSPAPLSQCPLLNPSPNGRGKAQSTPQNRVQPAKPILINHIARWEFRCRFVIVGPARDRGRGAGFSLKRSSGIRPLMGKTAPLPRRRRYTGDVRTR
jgi:hypothetical protein